MGKRVEQPNARERERLATIPQPREVGYAPAPEFVPDSYTYLPAPGMPDTAYPVARGGAGNIDNYDFGAAPANPDTGAAGAAIQPTPGGSSPTPPLPTDSASDSAYRWILAVVVATVLLTLFARTRVGYTIVYYVLVLALLFLLLTNYQWIAAALAPLAGSGGTQ